MRKRYYLQINDGMPIDITGLNTISIGRSSENTIFINNPQISRRQCIIDISREPLIITDGDGLRKRSKNGTKINNKILYGNDSNEKIKTSLLKNDDIIFVGDVKIKFIVESPEIETDSDITLT